MHRARTIAAISKAAEHLPLFEVALVLVHLDHVATGIINPDHSIMWSTVKFRIIDCKAGFGVPLQLGRRSYRFYDFGFKRSVFFDFTFECEGVFHINRLI